MNFPEHKCGLYLKHNEHKDSYQPIKEYIDEQEDFFDFESDEDKAECIRTDELWSLHWYPETPIGFIAIAAPTLEKLLRYANEGA